MNKEEELLSKRIQELARLADVKYCPTYTDFLNLNEQNILQQTLPKLAYVQVACFGGYEGAERQIAAFVPDALIVCRNFGTIRSPVFRSGRKMQGLQRT